MLDRLMGLYGQVPPQVQTRLRRWLVLPGKRLLSHGVIRQRGFVLARRLDQSIPLVLLRHGCYEPELSALLRHYLRPGDLFMDIGANVGYFTLLGAACVGPTGQVHSFEPNPETFAALRRNIVLNGFAQVAANNLAIAEQPATLQLWHAPDIDSGLASLRRTTTLLTEAVECKAVTLDDYVQQRGIGKVRAIKLDIEGAELLALRGAEHLLTGPNRPDLIALELVRAHTAAFGISPAELLCFLGERGYVLQRLGTVGAVQLSPLTDADLADMTLVALAQAGSATS